MKNIARLFIYFCLFSLLIYGFIYLGKKDYSVTMTSAEKFSREYPNISTDNPYTYVNSKDVLNLFENRKTGILLMGFSSNQWMQKYVEVIHPIFTMNHNKEVLYYDIEADRTKRTKNYQKIETYLYNYLKKTDMYEGYLYTPALVFVKDGVIVGYEDSSSIVSNALKVEDYWTEEKVIEVQSKIQEYINLLNMEE